MQYCGCLVYRKAILSESEITFDKNGSFVDEKRPKEARSVYRNAFLGENDITFGKNESFVDEKSSKEGISVYRNVILGENDITFDKNESFVDEKADWQENVGMITGILKGGWNVL